MRYWASINKNNHSLGFTIVELVVVIVVIAVLASIVIVSYNGVTDKSHETSLKSDLSQNGTLLELSGIDKGSYPTSQSESGVKSSGDTKAIYTPALDGTGYCLSVENWGKSYIISHDNKTPRAGYCIGSIAKSDEGGASTLPPLQRATVTTYAGSGAAGSTDSPTATNARFNAPSSVAVDATGVVYVSDTYNSLIRKIIPSGAVSTITGTQLQSNSGVAVGSNGIVAIADTNQHRIRQVSATGVVSTLAGSGTAGYLEGTGTAARFNSPYGVAISSDGSVYVADGKNNRIRKVTTNGTTSPVALSGIGPLNSPNAIAIDTVGTIYIADTHNHRIIKLTASGVASVLAGGLSSGYKDGTGAAAQFSSPYGVAVDSAGFVYVADGNNNRIRKITPAGEVTTIAGTGAAGFNDGSGSEAVFNEPSGIAVDSSGILYVADFNNHRIRKIVQ